MRTVNHFDTAPGIEGDRIGILLGEPGLQRFDVLAWINLGTYNFQQKVKRAVKTGGIDIDQCKITVVLEGRLQVRMDLPDARTDFRSGLITQEPSVTD